MPAGGLTQIFKVVPDCGVLNISTLNSGFQIIGGTPTGISVSTIDFKERDIWDLARLSTGVFAMFPGEEGAI